MENIGTLTLGEIVKQNYRAAAVFEKFAIDFCCMGNRTFDDACKESKVDSALVSKELQQINTEKGDGVNFDSWPLDLLVDYICKKHHKYVEEKTPIINAYLDKIYQVHGSRHPELLEVRDIFSEIGGELAVHMKKEELMLFPYIKKLEHNKNGASPLTSPLFGSVSNPVEMMKDDHAVEGEKFRRLAALTNNYQIPADACNTFAVTYQMLDEYEKDLHIHIHLENNILFPKAIAIEERINATV
jgi:regulator of cell morphogenesis and NO signaling